MLTALLSAGVVVGGISGAFLAPQALRPGAVRRLRERCRARRMVCLTFDDGPGPDLTPRVLDLLERHGVRATFYLLGFRAEASPGTADMVRDRGHEVGAHTKRHLNAWKTTPWAAHADVVDGYRGLAPWLGEAGRFRPPYGKLNIGSWAALRRRRAPIDWWTVDSGDTWERLPSPDGVAERVVRERGGVVLLHDFDREADGARRADFVLRTADMVIDRARGAGLSLGTMSQLTGALSDP